MISPFENVELIHLLYCYYQLGDLAIIDASQNTVIHTAKLVGYGYVGIADDTYYLTVLGKSVIMILDKVISDYMRVDAIL